MNPSVKTSTPSMDLPQIGRFEVQRLLATTPSHLVYLAKEPDSSRLVTLTVSARAEKAEANAISMRREWGLLRELNHPGIQRVLELGEKGPSDLYLVKEYVDGIPLANLLNKRFPTEVSLHLLIQLMQALETAERAGVVHGDIKPEHAILQPDGRLVLIDFHLGRQNASAMGEENPYVSPGYTAPEIIQGDLPTHHSDQFSFAVLAHQLLTGSMPFHASSPVALLMATCSQPPAFPKDLSVDAQLTFQKALDKDPARRFQSFRAFVEGLVASMGLSDRATDQLLDFAEGGSFPPLDLSEMLHDLSRKNDGHLNSSTRPLSEVRPAAPPKPSRRTPLWLPLAALTLLVLGGVTTWRWVHRVRPVPVEPQVAMTISPTTRVLDVQTEPAGAEISLDGRPMGISPLSRLEVPEEGTHELRVKAEGFQERRISLNPGDRKLDLIKLEALPVASAEPPETPRSKPEPSRKLAERPVEASKAKASANASVGAKAPESKKEFNLFEQLKKEESGN